MLITVAIIRVYREYLGTMPTLSVDWSIQRSVPSQRLSARLTNLKLKTGTSPNSQYNRVHAVYLLAWLIMGRNSVFAILC